MTVRPPARPLIGTSDALRRVVAYAAKVARTDATVLITGETGTGKENIAQYIHAHGRRRANRFVPINCSALPDGLFEGEMFGYERGAFTGAERAYEGKLALANGGTVFLDEIGELSAAAQSKLLRVLESREVFRLGARTTQWIDVRVMAATNQDLEQLARDGRFRADLFFRLNVARLHLPPLRARPDDIPALMAHYIAEMAGETSGPLGPLAPETLDFLMRYSWPGNIRELRNVVEALFIDPPDGPVGPEHLPPNLLRAVGAAAGAEPPERARILSALLATRWNKVRAAEQLRWSRMTLYRKMSKYGIRDDEGAA